MFPRGSGSQEPFSSRNQSNLPVSNSTSNVGLSSLVQSVETSGFSQNVLPGSGSHWPIQNIQSSISAVQGYSQSTQGLALPLPSHHPTNTGTSRLPTLPSSSYPPTESTAQSSIGDITPIKQEIGSEDPRGLGISSYSMSVASDPYFAGPMQHNSHQYAWTNRPYQPLQPPGQMIPPFPSSHPSYPSSGYPMGYPSHLNGPLPGYQHQEHQLPASYLPASGNPSRHSQPRSPPTARSYHTQSASGTPQSEHIMTSGSTPPYMISQPSYYFPDTSGIPPHPTPISSHPPSMTAPEPIYSSPESAAATDSDPIRVLSLRPRPQCWDHGCNGREFSTFSNLLRHQREKSGVVAKAECPICSAVFTRTTARNIHVAQGKCKSSGRDSSAE
ncbi:unnamed protein product [Penicillium camemberti]|uniref:Str. FM013 n=1 Tax=Penicillium camemberti (strain FM 013) TaxID=1429867 RepID=A0A0G4PUH0_PENC3|nr:unnamed protein product [Penicillium camemberti]